MFNQNQSHRPAKTGNWRCPAGSDHVTTAMNDITAVTSFDACERWLSRGCCSVLLFVSAAITVTERDTGRLETPGCLRPRWAASSLGELAPNPPLNRVNSRSPLLFSFLFVILQPIPPARVPALRRDLPRARAARARHTLLCQQGARRYAHTHTHTRLYLKRRRLMSDLRQDTVTTKLFFSSNGDVGYRACPVTPFPVLHRGVDRGRSVCGRQQHRQHHVPPAVVGLHQV